MFIKLTLFILTLCFIIIHTVLYIFAIERETFEDRVILIADNPLNVKNAVNMDSKTYEKIIDSIRYSGTIDKNIITGGQKIEFHVDPYIDHYIFNSTKKSDTYKDGIFVCLSHQKLDSNDCIWNLEGKIVAYTFVSDYLFVQALMKAYRLDPSKVQLKKITVEDISLVNKIFDYYITYVVLDSEYKTLLENSLYYINGFKDVDMGRIKPFYPFIQENYNTMRYYFRDEKTKDYVNKENSVLIPKMNYNIIRDITETFITRLEKPEDHIGDQEKNQIGSIIMLQVMDATATQIY